MSGFMQPMSSRIQSVANTGWPALPDHNTGELQKALVMGEMQADLSEGILGHSDANKITTLD